MHEHNREYPLLVNAEVDSMGGVVDCGVADTKASPLHTAIEKAQAELRQEYDVREVRRRELEFLENGGDPLDFKIGHAASISVQSTSLTDQLAEQYVISSEAKGSFALAASPHGDSVESCGRLGGSLGREANIADNLLLFDGENSNIDGERNVNSTGKRGNAAQAEQFSLVDSNYNGKESEDSVIFRLGLKGQAYARRNRSRSSRDNVLASPTDLILGHSNKSSISPSPHPDSREEKGSLYGAQPEDHAISSISNSKPMSSKGNVVSKAFASDDQLDMELDAIQTQHTCSDMIKGGLTEGEVEPKVSENLRVSDHENQHSHIAPVDVTNGTASRSSDFIAKEETVSVGFLSAPLGSTENIRETLSAERVNGSNASINGATDLNDDLRRKKYALDTVTEILSMKNTRPNPYHVSTSTSIDVGGNVDQSSMLRRVDVSSDRDSKDHSAFTGTPIIPNNNVLKEKSQLIAVDAHIVTNDEPISVNPNPSNSSIQIKDEVELCEPVTDMEDETRPLNGLDSVKLNSEVISKLERIQNSSFGDSSHSIDKAEIITSTLVQPSCEPANAMLSKRVAATTSELQNGATNHLKLAKKSHEDAILNEARIIEANLRRAGQLPMCTMSSEKRKKCHWDFVLEEMAWMANDFMQERIWKTTVAAQVCHWIASSGQTKFKQENISRRHKSIARTLAKAIMHFWHSVEIFRSSGKALNDTLGSDLFKSWKVNEVDAEKNKVSNNVEAENTVPILQPAIQGYAVRFLDYNSSMSMHPILAEAPATPDRINDAGILEMSGEDQLSEESLFYMVPPGAMQAYRESVESQWGHSKKTSNILHEEECEASMCDSVADGSRENAYEEDEGETGTYLFPGSFEGGLSSKFAHRKKKDLQQKSYARRLYEVGSDLSYEHCMEVKSGNQPFMFTGKRPSSTLNVGSAPIKRARRAARHRVVSPFSAGVTGSLQVTSKTDVSSDDTNSFQDDQSSLHGGSHSRRNLEVEYTADFERQMPFDGCEISSKSKKKKKPKHLGYKNSLNLNNSGVLLIPGKGSLFEQRLQVDSMVKNEQRDYMKKRSESQHFESNGNCGHYRQHAVKKPKLLKQLPETSPEAINPFTGSMPSPVASQMSNMSSPHKLIKTITNRDRGRKSKAMKMAAGQSGSGIPWSNFEEQALVVLVHDMGTNWELISDAINSTLQFKRVFRRPSECKEHHKFLMDSSGDGADSAEDSGSSQPYETTLRGIPKGSARQLFQRLRAPVEEDTLKAHFEKIILIGQKLHACRSQNVSQELKQPTPAHSSHAVALSQVCPNNLTGGVLTPLDLCEASSLDVLPLGYQGSHSNGLPIPTHQGSGASVLPTSSANPMLQGSPSMVLGNSLPSPSASHNGSTRDAQRYGMPRPISLPADDQQRMPQYNHMISGRNIPQSSMSVPGALSVGVDRSVRMLPGGTGMGMMCGINRGMPMPRPGYQGISPPGMLNMVSTGSMLSGSGVGMPMPVNIHPSSVSVPGNSMMRPRDALQILRPGQNTEDHRQMMMQELQLQVSQGNGQSVSPFNGMSASFSSATVPPPVQTFPGQQHQQSHQMPQQPHMLGSPHHPHMQATNHSSPQQQAYAIRFAKDRQLQQRVMPQPQHPFTGSNTISPIQNSPQVQQQGQSSSPSNPIASSQSQHKHQQIPRNPQSGNGIPNPMMKPRQRQQVQHQQPRSQQQQRQTSQQQGKVAKGLGRGAILMHQNLSVDSSHASGLSTVPKNQVSEKHIMQQGQGFFPGNSVLNQTLSQPSNQPKMYPRPLPQTSKQMSQIASHSDNPNQGSVQVPPSHTLLASQQPPVPSSLPLVTQQQQQQQQQTNQSQQSMQRMSLQQNRQINSDGRIQSSTDQVQVNQMISATSIQQCSDSSAPVVSSGIQWKPEPSYETSTPTSSAHLASSPQENLAGTESLMPPSSQGLVQRQVSGSLSMPKHGIGGQWQQQQQPQQQQQQQQPQLQHRQAAPQGNLYARPSSSGPG